MFLAAAWLKGWKVYDWPFLYVCNLEENVLFSTLILGLVFNDYVVFYGYISLIL